MKYPSVFLAILFVWVVVDGMSLYFHTPDLTYRLYLATVVFTVATFLIGFWRNR